MRVVADACGIGGSLLYRYYPSKLRLLEAVVDDVLEGLEELNDALAQAAQRNGDIRARLLELGTIYMRHVDAWDAWYTVWCMALPLDDSRRARLVATQERVFATVADALRGNGWNDPYVAARTLTGALFSTVMYQNRTRFETAGPQLRAAFLDELVALLLRSRLPAPTPIAR